MKSNFPPNISPDIFTIAGAVVGALCAGDFNAAELNSMGNWIIFVGQYLLTYAAQAQLIESRIENNNINVNSKEFKSGGSPYQNGGKSNQNQRSEVDFLLDAFMRIEKELKTIKNEIL